MTHNEEREREEVYGKVRMIKEERDRVNCLKIWEKVRTWRFRNM